MKKLYELANNLNFIPKNLSIGWKEDPYLWMCELQKWFREKHNLEIECYTTFTNIYRYNVSWINFSYKKENLNNYFRVQDTSESSLRENLDSSTYEEALEKALLKACKLIKNN